MTWRELIDQYLTGCATDDKNRLAAELHSDRQAFIEAHGSERFKSYENGRLESRSKDTEERMASPDSHVIIQEQDDLIIVEVQPAPNGHPFKLTRFRLIQYRGQWQLDDYLWKCQCSNGECEWCGGSGICAVCHGEGECKFCLGDHVCQLCKGARACRICKDSDMPGWNSMARSG
jgi:hypothetical protein